MLILDIFEYIHVSYIFCEIFDTSKLDDEEIKKIKLFTDILDNSDINEFGEQNETDTEQNKTNETNESKRNYYVR